MAASFRENNYGDDDGDDGLDGDGDDDNDDNDIFFVFLTWVINSAARWPLASPVSPARPVISGTYVIGMGEVLPFSCYATVTK